MVSEKKRKIADENRTFQERWEDSYFVIQSQAGSSGKCQIQCLICLQTIAVPKEYNIKRHYNSQHKNFDKFEGKLRHDKLCQLKSLSQQRHIFNKVHKSSEDVVIASYVVSQMIAKTSHPFTEGQFVKDCLVDVAQILCPEKVKIFSEISLSANTVARRITEMSASVEKQLISLSQNFDAYSLALDESTGVCDTAFCAIFIRGIDKDLKVTEEIFDLVPLKDTTTGRDVSEAFESSVEGAGLKWENLVSVATDGAPAMCSENCGVIGLVKAKQLVLGCQPIVPVHCLIHQEALCGKVVKLRNVMDVVVRIVNIIRARSLNHRQFKTFLEQIDSEYGELLYHSEVRWLSRGKVLERFFELREETGLFMAMKQADVPELDNDDFCTCLAFLVDITKHLNTLNLKLQGETNIIMQMSDITAFKMRLTLWEKQLLLKSLDHFPSLKTLNSVDCDALHECVEFINKLKREFDRRFKELKEMKPQLDVFSNPFAVDVSDVPSSIQIELIDITCDSALKQKFSDVGVPQFYTYVDPVKYPNIICLVKKVLCMFGSTYVCERFFSTLKLNKTYLRSRLTDEHLKSSLRLATTRTIMPEISELVKEKWCQKSSQ